MRKLLYVEDYEDNLYMLQLRFDVLGGYEVLSARDGAAGIAIAARSAGRAHRHDRLTARPQPRCTRRSRYLR